MQEGCLLRPPGKWERKGTDLKHAHLYWDTVTLWRQEISFSIHAREEKEGCHLCKIAAPIVNFWGEKWRNDSCKYDSDFCESMEPLSVRGSQYILEVKGSKVCSWLEWVRTQSFFWICFHSVFLGDNVMYRWIPDNFTQRDEIILSRKCIIISLCLLTWLRKVLRTDRNSWAHSFSGVNVHLTCSDLRQKWRSHLYLGWK